MTSRLTRQARRGGVSSAIDNARRFWNRSFAGVAPEVRNAPPGRDLSDVVCRLRQSSAVRVVDVGCGLGHWSVTLARAGFRVTAIDVSSEAVRIVRERARSEGLPITTLVCAAQELPVPAMHADAIVCNSVLDHMRPVDAKQAARRIVRVLKPGGLAFVSFDGPAEEKVRSGERPDYSVLPDGTWEYVAGPRKGMMWRLYRDAEIRELFRALDEVEFTVAADGGRRVWFRKPG